MKNLSTKTTITWPITLACGALLTSVPENAQDLESPKRPLGIQASADLVSMYVWRGWILTHRDPVLQPSITYAPSFLPGASLNFWSSGGLVSKPSAGDYHNTIDEFDTTLEYARPIISDKLTMSAGGLWYYYPSDWQSYSGANRHDFELFLSLSYALHPYFSPYVTYYRGLDFEIRGNYLEFGVTGSKSFSEHWSIAPSAQAGYQDQYGLAGNITFVGFSVPLAYEVKGFTISPYYSFTFDLDDLNGEGRKGNSFGGLRLSYSF